MTRPKKRRAKMSAPGAQAARRPRPIGPHPITILRERKGLNRSQLAGLCGTGRWTVTLWEERGQEPSDKLRPRLAVALGVSVGDLGRLIYEYAAGLPLSLPAEAA